MVRVRDLSVEQFVVSLCLNTALSLLGILIFSIWRRKQRDFFAPRATPTDDLFNDDSNQSQFVNEDNTAAKSLAPTWNNSLFGWIWDTIKFPEAKLWKVQGVDAVFYLRALKLFIMLTVGMNIGSLLVLLPINLTAEPAPLAGIPSNATTSLNDTVSGASYHVASDYYLDDDADLENGTVSGMARFTMASLKSDDPSLTAHMLFTIIFSAFSVFVIWQMFRRFISHRGRYLYSKNGRTFTVLVKEIPVKMIGDREKLAAWFEERYPAQVLYIQFVYDTTDLSKLLEKRNEVMRKLRLRAHIRTDDLEAELANLERDIERLQDVDSLKPTRTAFLTFDSAFPIEEQRFPFNKEKMIVLPAPEPNDICWNHLPITRDTQQFRVVMVHIAVLILFILWSIPTLFIASLARLNTLQVFFPFLSFTSNLNRLWLGLLEGFLPGLVLLLSMLASQPVIFALVRWSGFHAKSLMEKEAMKHFYTFLIFNVLFVSTTGGTVFETFMDFFSAPEMLIHSIAQALPRQSLYFTNYTMFAVTGNFIFGFFRFYPMARRHFKRQRATTPQEAKEASEVEPFDYGWNMASDLLVFTYVIFYSVMSPLTLLFGSVYFISAYLVNKYNIVYVHKVEYQSSGTVWRSCFNRVMFAVLLFQIAMVAVMALRKFPGGFALVLPPPLTLLFWIWYNSKWSQRAMYNPIEQKDIDTDAEERYLLYEYYNAAPEQSSKPEDEEDEEEDSQPSYIQPTLWPLHSSYGGHEDLMTPTRTSSFFSVAERGGGSYDYESPKAALRNSKRKNYQTLGNKIGRAHV